MKSTWDLILAGRYEDACAAADEEYVKTRSQSRLFNKVIALLALYRFSDAALLCERLVGLSGDFASDGEYIYWGAAHWLQGNVEVALSTWKQGQKARFTDAAGGIHIPLLQFYAAIVLKRKDIHSEADAGIEKCIRQSADLGESVNPEPEKVTSVLSLRNWPGPIGLFLSKGLSKEQLYAIANQPELTPSQRIRRNLQACFYVAVADLARGDQASFESVTRKACSLGGSVMLDVEFFLARGTTGSGGTTTRK